VSSVGMAFADDDERSTAFACRVVLTSMAYHALVDVETLGEYGCCPRCWI
jgi:hypothetical protein